MKNNMFVINDINKIFNSSQRAEDYIESYIKQITHGNINAFVRRFRYIYIDYIITTDIKHGRYGDFCKGYVLNFIIPTGYNIYNLPINDIYINHNIAYIPDSFINIHHSVNGCDKFINKNKRANEKYYYRIKYRTYIKDNHIKYYYVEYIPLNRKDQTKYNNLLKSISENKLTRWQNFTNDIKIFDKRRTRRQNNIDLLNNINLTNNIDLQNININNKPKKKRLPIEQIFEDYSNDDNDIEYMEYNDINDDYNGCEDEEEDIDDIIYKHN